MLLTSGIYPIAASYFNNLTSSIVGHKLSEN